MPIKGLRKSSGANSRKSQAATEYILIVGIALMALIPLSIFVYTYIAGANRDITDSRTDRIATDIVSAAEKVYYLGPPSRTTLSLDFPQKVLNADVTEEKDLVFFVGEEGSPREILKSSPVKLWSLLTPEDLTPGKHNIKIDAEREYALVYTGDYNDALMRWCAYNIASQFSKVSREALSKKVSVYSPVTRKCDFESILANDFESYKLKVSAFGMTKDMTIKTLTGAEFSNEDLVWKGPLIKGFSFIYMSTALYSGAPEPYVLIEEPSCKDVDGDGYGTVLNLPAGTCPNPQIDCDDGNPGAHPNAEEICDDTEEIDEDCNGKANAADPACGAISCGDGTVQAAAGEECDDGAGNSDSAQNACRTNCEDAGCGDGIIDSGESCDDGNIIDGDGCTASCQISVVLPSDCGNNILEAGEDCDDGDANNFNSCPNDCKNAVCGDTVKEGLEECDDGLTPATACAYGLQSCTVCSASCVNVAGSATYCGDAVCQNGEEFLESNDCATDCYVCVDTDSTSSVWTSGAESSFTQSGTTQIIPGSYSESDYCSTVDNKILLEQYCTVNPTNPNGKWIDFYSVNCETVYGAGYYCNNGRCVNPVCGNALVEGTEDCEAGNSWPCWNAAQGKQGFTPCNAATCLWAWGTCDVSNCGNNAVDGFEECDGGLGCTGCLCDDGFAPSSPASAACIQDCGDGTVGTGETCDINSPQNSQACSTAQGYSGTELCNAQCDGWDACTTAESCGDNTAQIGSVEQCDGGLGCAANCACTAGYTQNTPVTAACHEDCGDGNIDAGEECDDGNAFNNDACNNQCLKTSCGDSTVQNPNGFSIAEQCDDGNIVSGDGCSVSCQSEICGDGIINDGNAEQCDGSALGGNSCADVGAFVSGGTLSCNADCTFNTAICIQALTCGNNVLETGIGEECDGAATTPANGACTGCNVICNNGFYETATHTCSTCTASQWTCDAVWGACISGTQSRVCTLSSPDYSTCGTTGKPAESQSCQLCGNSAVEAGETCDDGNAVGNDGCSSVCAEESGWICTENAQGLSSCITTCGDGLIRGSEPCDDGNTNNADSCLNTCISSRCGDRVKKTTSPTEGCDDGCGGNSCTAIDNGDGCSSVCAEEYGWICNEDAQGFSSCTTTCGDGLKAAIEACDDGDITGGDGCSSTCQIETATGWTCGFNSANTPDSTCQKCGNTIIEGTEVCDGNTQACFDPNAIFDLDTQTCSSSCTWNACVVSYKEYDTPTNAYSIAILGSNAYIADQNSLKIVDTTSTPPTLRATNAFASWDVAISQASGIAYVAQAMGGIRAVNIANPSSPSTISQLGYVNNYARGIDVYGNYAYIADSLTELRIIDISNPSSMILVGSLLNAEANGDASDINVTATRAYIADGPAGIKIIDISNPASPSLIASLDLTGEANGIARRGNRLYVATGSTGVQIIDITNENSPTLVGSYDTTGYAYDVAVMHHASHTTDIIFVADGNSGIQVLRMPAAGNTPIFTETLDTPGSAMGVTIAGTNNGELYIADYDKGMRIIPIYGTISWSVG
ncbi:MAG TPA: DUF4215 domain-containing protein [Candidatus Nanoarchaeia archaeon]|nr:DUF4215 domain-containing protein [Candidatus Nanoarchaeia archaeon]